MSRYSLSWATHLQPSALGPFLSRALGSFPTHWTMPSSGKGGVSGSPSGQVRSRPGCHPPLNAPLLALELPGERGRGSCGSRWASRPVFKALASCTVLSLVPWRKESNLQNQAEPALKLAPMS